MNFYGKTDVGRLRHSNQDDFLIARLPDDSLLAVVCDGMGGANAGNVASKNATQMIVSFFERSYRNGLDAQGVIALLQSAILSANIEIHNMAQKDSEFEGMGTTVVAAFVAKDFITVSHVGDSRAYLVGDEVRQLTRDHSVVQSLIESGKLSPEEAKVHPRRNIITRALGIEPEILVDSIDLCRENNETLILCTDGLSNFITTKEIEEIVKNNSAKDSVDVFIKRANNNGGADNITVVVLGS